MNQTPQAVEQRGSLILIVDDQSTGRAILEEVVRSIDARVSTQSYANPLEALTWAKDHLADLVLVDYLMPELNGLELAKRMRELADYKYVPIVMVTIYDERKVRYDALDAGITDFLTKPIDAHECLARCRNLLTMRRQHLALNEKNRIIEQMVRDATSELRMREREALQCLAMAAESTTSNADEHLSRISLLSRILAEQLQLSADAVERIELAALLHDVGKLRLATRTTQAVSLTNEDPAALMRQHAQLGFELLRQSLSPVLREAAMISYCHHERFDGRGYPRALRGDEIPLCARIVAVADVLDALLSRAVPDSRSRLDHAFEYIRANEGSWFDPSVVRALQNARPRIDLALQGLAEHPQARIDSASSAPEVDVAR